MRHYCRRSFSFFIRLKKLFFIIYVNNLHLSGHVVPMILQYLLLYQHLQLSAQCTGQLHSQAEPRLSEQYSMQVNFLFLLLFDVYNQFGNSFDWKPKKMSIHSTQYFNPISAWVYLKSRLCWGGGQLDPTLNPIFEVQI